MYKTKSRTESSFVSKMRNYVRINGESDEHRLVTDSLKMSEYMTTLMI